MGIGVYGYRSGSYRVKATSSGSSGGLNTLSGSDLNFPASGNNWINYEGSRYHTATGGISGMNDLYAIDLNLANNAENGLPVRPIANGRVVYKDNHYGFILVRHTIPLRLDNGTILNTWYSGYMHMTNLSQNNIDVTTDSTLGNISSTGAGGLIHLHFGIYSGSHTPLSSLTSIDVANNLTDFVNPITTWGNWCTAHLINYTSPWWDLGEVPCP